MQEFLIRPFAGLRPTPETAAEVAAPPYDVLNTEEARRRADGHRWSFLHVSKPEIDLPPETDPHAPEVYARGAENLDQMRAQGVLIRDPSPCLYVYRLTMAGHRQTGIVGAGSIAAYQANRIRRHELTRPDKEDDRVRQIEALAAQTGPVMVTHRADAAIAAVIATVTERPPAYSVAADGDVEHTLWVIDDDREIDVLCSAFESMEAIYIADGHHRSAAAARVADAEVFLLVSFPDDEVKILDYNRLVADLNGLTSEAFLQRIDDDFEIELSDGAVRPATVGAFGMYLDGQWYRLGLKQPVTAADPVADLDISLLSDRLLGPVLGVGDPRLDKRIDFVGGIRGVGELQRRVDSGEMAVAFSLFPTSLKALMAVADAGRVMPPKSTWFEPKLADGLVSLVLD